MVPERSTIRAAALVALAFQLVPSGAAAGAGDITFCNEFPHKVYVAIAYLQTDVNNYLARGWLNIETGKCFIFDTAIRIQTFYYHAESDPYKEGRHRVKHEWGKGKKFAVRDGHFQSYNAETKYSGMHFAEFSKGAETTGDAVTCTVTFLASGGSSIAVPPPGASGGDRPGGLTEEATPRLLPGHDAEPKEPEQPSAIQVPRGGTEPALPPLGGQDGQKN